MKISSYISAFLSLLLLSSCLPSEEEHIKSWMLYDSLNSVLPGNYVRALAIDENNHKWIGTVHGLVKVEGEDWKLYTTENSQLPGNNIFKILIDSNNTAWVGTFSNGLVHIDGDQWTLYDSSNSILPDNEVRAMGMGNQGVWVGTNQGLVKIGKEEWALYTADNSGLPDKEIRALVQEEDTLWIGANNLGLVKFHDSSWTIYNTEETVLQDPDVHGIAIAPNKDIWVATWNGFARFNRKEFTQTYLPDGSSLLNSQFIRDLCKVDDMVYACTGGFDEFGGIIELREDQWMLYDNKNTNLPHNTISTLKKDKDGRFWVGTLKGLAVDSIP